MSSSSPVTKNRGVFCYKAHDKMAFRRDFFLAIGTEPCLFHGNPLYKRTEDISSCFTRKKCSNTFGVFWQPCPAVSAPATPF